MRILRVAQKVYPDVVGGGSYHIHAMSRDQAKMGHDVTVLTVGTDTEQSHVEQRDGYTVVRYPSIAQPLGNAASSGVASFLANADEFDVVHAHSHLYFSTNLTALGRRLGSTPLAITNHGLYSQTAPEWLFDMYLRTLGRWTFDSADVVFCYTEEDRNRLRERGISTDIAVVHNGIDTDRFTPDGPVHDAIHGNPAVLFVGRLVEGKRPGDALAAFNQLRDRFPDSVLNICGEGPLRGDLEAEARQCGLADSVSFLGHLPYDEMPAVYRAGDVLVLPSRAEGLPRTVLEAMASGTPVVVSNLEQVAPVINDEAGETVPVGDVRGVAAALATILDAPESYSPAETVAGHYDWSDTVEQTTAALENIAGGNK